MKILKRFILVLLFFALLFALPPVTQSQDCNSKEECENLIKEYEQKLTDLGNQRTTLSSQIEFMDTQIYLTTLQIQETENKIVETEKEIENLSGRIGNLNVSLDHLSRILLQKIVTGYKHRETPFLDVFIDSESASTLFNRIKYAKVAEENDRKVAFQMQQAKLNFEEQKSLREQKKAELDQLTVELSSRKTDLDNQKADRQRLLAQTQNDERTYQRLLALARAEYAAIQGIIAGGGTETELRNVSKGETIASVIDGQSCNSSGTHVHFIVQEGGSVNNPFDYLHDVPHENDSGDPWTPNASKANWDWPISPTIYLHQGFGVTSCVTSGWCGQIYSSHNGLDFSGSSSNVTAVADGTLYRGSYAGGCTLPYTKVVHKDSNISTLYLHTYTQ